MTCVLHACDITPSPGWPHRRHLWLLVGLSAWLAAWWTAPASAAESTHAAPVAIDATAFTRHFVTDPAALAAIRRTGNLGGRGPGDSAAPSVQGWFEYAFETRKTGWYQLLVQGNAGGAGHLHEFVIDGETRLNARGYPGALAQSEFKAGNVWLAEGIHRLRVQRLAWQGMDGITGFRLVPAGAGLADRLDIRLADDPHFIDPFVRRGEPLALRLLSNGVAAGELSIEVRNLEDGRIVHRVEPGIAPQARPYALRIEIPTPKPGAFGVSYRVGGRPIAARDVRPIRFDVIDTTRADAADRPLSPPRGRRVSRIDCATRAPDYASRREATRLRTLDAGGRDADAPTVRYRESGDRGFRQHRDGGSSWFGYRLDELQGQRPYLLRIAYPDDALRTFTVTIHEPEPLYYPPSQGVDSGGEFTTSGRLQVLELPYWPRSNGAARLVLHNAQNGRRAACAWIEVTPLPAGPPPAADSAGRHFGHWFEEPDRWAAVYGAATRGGRPTRAGYIAAADRWASTVRAIGGDTLAISATAYALSLYPVRHFNLEVADSYTPDLMRLLLLTAERHGLRVLVDLHPRASEPGWAGAERLLHDLDGYTHLTVPVGRGHGARSQQPRYNAAHPANQAWLAGFVDEFLERYGDHAALAGIGLRVAAYDNNGLSNLHNLRWGYGDFTVRRFARETGIDFTAATPGERHRLLTGRDRDAWLAWRSGLITDLLGRIAQKVRRHRADLGLYVMVFGDPFVGENPAAAGLDPARLDAAGVTLIDAPHKYGRFSNRRRVDDAILDDQRERDKLLDEGFVARLQPDHGNGAVLFPARYFELPASGLPRARLGLAAAARPLQLSAHIAPAGRHHLERYALALAASDAALLLNGGVGHFIDQPVMREFLHAYRRLPALPFTKVPAVGDAVVGRRLDDGAQQRFYLINRLPVDVTVALRYAGGSADTPEGTDQSAAETVTLAPFELRVFDAPDTRHLASIRSTPAAAFATRLREQGEWLTGFARRVARAVDGQRILQRDARLAVQYATAARSAAADNRYATLRRLVQQRDMQRLYRVTGLFPPGWPPDYRSNPP